MAGRSTSLVIEVITDASKAQQGLQQVSGKVENLGSSLAKSLGGIALGAGILKFGSDSVKAAAQAEQAVGGVAAVFKGQASQIEKAAQGAAKSIGLSTSSYEQLATVLGSQLKTAGFNDFASKTKELIGLGADLAAMYGGTTADAVEAISSLMKGERDPIEKYGVSMKQASIDAEVLALGLDTSTESAKQHAQAQASLSLLYKQTADASGAAAREQDSASARYQQFTATVENLEAAIGSALLPALSGLLEVAIDAAPAIQAIGEAVSGALAFVLGLPAPILAAATALATLALLKGPISSLISVVKGFSFGKLLTALGGPWALAITAAVAGVTALVMWFKSGEATVTDFSGAVDEATGKLSALKLLDALPDTTTDDLRKAGIAASDYAKALADGGPPAEALKKHLQDIVAADTFQSMTESGDAIDQVGEKGKAAAALLKQFGADGEQASLAVADAADKAKLATDGVTGGIKDMSAAAQASTAKLDAMNKLLADPEGLAKAAVDSDDLSTALKKSSDDAATAGRQLSFFKLSMDDVHGSSRSVVDSQIAFGEALQNVADLGKEGGAALKLTNAQMAAFDVAALSSSKEGAQFASTMLDTKDAYIATVAATYSATEATQGVAAAQDAASGTADSLYKSLLDQAKGLGLNDEQARQLLASVGILDGQQIRDKDFKILADDSDASKKLSDIIAMKILDKTATVIVQDLASEGISKINQTKVDPKTGLITVEYNDGAWRQYTPEGKHAQITIGFNYPPNYDPVTGTIRSSAPKGGTMTLSAASAAPAALGLHPQTRRTVTATLPVTVQPSINITVNGALDVDGTARTIQNLLTRRDRRAGPVAIR